MAIFDRKTKKDEVQEDRAPKSVREDPQADDARADMLPAGAADIEAILNEDSMASILPTPPKLPGWHYLWASTTNDRTPVQFYYRLGYVAVKTEEVPGMKHLRRMQSAEFDGFVTCNEMVLLKTTEENYQRYMKIVHHDRPNEEANRLLHNIQTMKEEVGVDSDGRSLVQEVKDGGTSGFKDMERDARLVSRKFE